MSGVAQLRAAEENLHEAVYAVPYGHQVAERSFTTQPEDYVGRRRQPRSRRRISLAMTVAVLACCFGLGIGLVAIKSKYMVLSYHLSELQVEMAELERVHGYLQLSLMQAHSPQIIESHARGRLGMVAPERVEYLVLAPIPEDSSHPGVEQPTQEAPTTGLVAVVSGWLTDNWPRLGRAEASTRP